MKVKDSYVWQDPLSALFFWGCIFISLVAAYYLNRLLRKITENKERARLALHLYDGILLLFYHNLPQLTLLGLVFMVFYLNFIPYINYQLLVNLIYVWLIFRNLILMFRMVLVERITETTAKDAKLYYRIKWLLLSGGFITTFMVISHLLPLSTLLQDLFNRLFMLFLLVGSLIFLKGKEVFLFMLSPLLKSKKTYIRNAVNLLIVLVPVTLFTTALFGLVGYTNLAWAMSWYQIYILLVIVGFVLVRGLSQDVLDILSEWMVKNLANGWLWIEVIIKPVDKLLRLMTLLLSFAILFQLFGLLADPQMWQRVNTVSHYTLVDISGIHITFLSIAEFLVFLCVFIWISKWTREFCYRRLYRHTEDEGIRNSLSVFTQYGVIVLGSFIALRVLGLDFSGMAMILGGLAVGMGFGLRDFASNIVGGIMLLIERPVREGDLITLGEYEGKVEHIGIRTMRISSWDNMQVLIPNAETFNKPFTNWTHQDSIVRTVIPVKVCRADDPELIQRMLLAILATFPEVLKEPVPQVFLKQIDEALIEFEIRYFINVQEHTRFEVRSKILFAIMAWFKEADIQPPIPPYSVEIKEGHGDSRKNDSED